MEIGYLRQKKRLASVISTMLCKVPMAHCCNNSAMHYCCYKRTTLLLHTIISGAIATAAAAAQKDKLKLCLCQCTAKKLCLMEQLVHTAATTTATGLSSDESTPCSTCRD
jgi:hypothetical protein